MINLLPYKNKQQIRAARHNVILLKCLVYLLLGIAFISLACFATYQFLKNNNNSTNQATTNIQENNATSSTTDNYIDEFSSNIKLAKSILSQRIGYSNIITEMASLIPAGVVIDNISIDGQSINEPMSIYFRAKDQNAGQLIKNSFKQSKLFYNLKIISVTSSRDDQSGYPHSITISLQVNKAFSV